MSRLNDPRLHVRFNVVAMLVWAVLLPPTLILWRESVFYVVLMSWYAIVVGHLSALMASKAEEKADKEA